MDDHESTIRLSTLPLIQQSLQQGDLLLTLFFLLLDLLLLLLELSLVHLVDLRQLLFHQGQLALASPTFDSAKRWSGR